MFSEWKEKTCQMNLSGFAFTWKFLNFCSSEWNQGRAENIPWDVGLGMTGPGNESPRVSKVLERREVHKAVETLHTQRAHILTSHHGNHREMKRRKEEKLPRTRNYQPMRLSKTLPGSRRRLWKWPAIASGKGNFDIWHNVKHF